MRQSCQRRGREEAYPVAARGGGLADLADELDHDDLKDVAEGVDLADDRAEVFDRLVLIAVEEHDERVALARRVSLLAVRVACSVSRELQEGQANTRHDT